MAILRADARLSLRRRGNPKPLDHSMPVIFANLIHSLMLSDT